jgi:hypothetical protein
MKTRKKFGMKTGVEERSGLRVPVYECPKIPLLISLSSPCQVIAVQSSFMIAI